MAETDYEVGDARRLQGTFTDINDAAADPTTVTFKIKPPTAANVTTYVYGTDAEVVKSATGVYYVDWTIAEVGTHSWYMKGTGAVIAVGQDSFNAKPLLADA